MTCLRWIRWNEAACASKHHANLGRGKQDWPKQYKGEEDDDNKCVYIYIYIKGIYEVAIYAKLGWFYYKDYAPQSEVSARFQQQSAFQDAENSSTVHLLDNLARKE